MHKILVPIDGSQHALKALRIACDLAGKYDGHVLLLHVLDTQKSSVDLLGLDCAHGFTQTLRETLEQATGTQKHPVPINVLKSAGNEILAQAEKRCRHQGVEASSLTLESGDPVETILMAYKRTDASTIVMGCRGSGAAGDPSFGSVSRTVFERADCTCISVK